MPVAVSAVSRLWVARTLLSTVYRLVCVFRIEYGAARCSAKCTIASGRISSSTPASRSYSVARSRFTNPMALPDTSCQTRVRSLTGRIGVSDSTSSSTSIFRRIKLSMMVTSWPRSDRYNDVGQPQNPSPPRTITRIPTPITLRHRVKARGRGRRGGPGAAGVAAHRPWRPVGGQCTQGKLSQDRPSREQNSTSPRVTLVTQSIRTRTPRVAGPTLIGQAFY